MPIEIPSFDEEPLVEGAATLDLVAPDPQLGDGAGGLVEARVTPGRHQLTRLSDDSPGAIRPDPRMWSMFCFYLPFTLHEPAAPRRVSSLRCDLATNDDRITAYSLFPASVSGEQERTIGFKLSPSLKIEEVEVGFGDISRQTRTMTVVPEIDSFGEGEEQFYWIHRPLAGTKSVRFGSKHCLTVLQVRFDVEEAQVRAEWKADVRRPFLGSFRSFEANATAEIKLAFRSA